MNIFNKKKVLLAVLMASVFNHQPLSAQQKEKQPNIILILVDDMGFSDIGAFGSKDIKTPNIDKLANEGVRVKEFYNNGICAPTRASLLTGQYQHKAGVGFFNVNLGTPAYQGFLNKESLTIAEVLKSGGYRTAISGKWHVGDHKTQWPNQRGFDQSFGFIGGAVNFFEIGEKDKPTVPLFKNGVPYYLAKDTHLTDEITKNALEFIGNKQSKQPFFLYLAFNAPHWPLQAKKEDIEKYKGVFNKGWDSLRVERYKNAIEAGVFDKNHPIALRDTVLQKWDKLTYDEKQYWALRQEVFAAMLDHVDQSIGKVLTKLKESKQDENTLIIFLSDNGAQGGDDLKLYTSRNTGPVGSAGSYEMQTSHWSQTGNSPLKNYKGQPYEGGISTPLIAWYPKKIKSQQTLKGLGHIIDIAPTFYEFAGIKYPSQLNGIKSNALAGKSLVSVLKGEVDVVKRNEPIFWERAGNKAVREGKWKLISSTLKKGEFELYNIDIDRGETKNLAKEYPEVVKQLIAKYDDWAKKTGVIEYQNLRKLPFHQQIKPANNIF